jgi:septal ring factor EnvC (AmiA/AmiB activator)
MASDLAAVEQEIEQLKASIEQLKTSQEQMVRNNAEVAEQLKAARAQMARDNENAAEQLKASQEQMARLIAKASEQNLQPETSAPPPRPIALRTRKPVPKLSSPQARARPLAPVQGRPE